MMRIITIILVYDNDSVYDDEKIARKVDIQVTGVAK